MNVRVDDAYTYMGLLDDSVQRYPWRFKVDNARLNYLLVVELINGKPVLLNDGYLVNNEFVRSEILKRDGLIWELIRAGFVRVMFRGGDEYRLDELPGRMAPQIPSFADVVADRVAGVSWKDLRDALHRIDGELRSGQAFVPWPSFDVGSGFLGLVENLRARGVSPHVLGIGRHVSKTALACVLDEVADRLSKDLRASRTVWEQTVLKYADDTEVTNRPYAFVAALMNLANEMYHYNMGILLAADFGASVSVQTQTSPAFDDLLVPPSLKFLLDELPSVPRLHVPLSITQVDPLRLASVLRPGSDIFDARERWIRLRNAWDRATPVERAAKGAELRDAGDEYAKRLSQFVGGHVKFKETEELVEFVVGDLLKFAAAAAAGTALVAVGAPAAVVAGGTLGGMVLGYAVTRARKRALGSVFKKFRVEAIERTLRISSQAAEASERVMRAIKRRQVPSTIQIDPSVVTAMASRLKRFDREA